MFCKEYQRDCIMLFQINKYLSRIISMLKICFLQTSSPFDFAFDQPYGIEFSRNQT